MPEEKMRKKLFFAHELKIKSRLYPFPLVEYLNIPMFAGRATEHGVIVFLNGDSPFLVGDLFFKIFLAFITKPSIAFWCYP